MKNSGIVFLLFLASFFLACDGDDTVAKIDGELTLSEGLEASSLIGVPVYLYEVLGVFVSAPTDSVMVDSELAFSFTDVEFGSYMIALGKGYEIAPDTVILRLDEDHAYEKLVFSVSLPE